MIVETPRLVLQPFSSRFAADHERLFADPEVTRFLGAGPGPPEEVPARSRAVVTAFVAHWARHGFGVWAVLDRADGAFIGQCGLRHVPEDWGLGPEVEVLYALARVRWGAGLAREAAAAVVRHGFDSLGLPRVVAVTRPENVASRRVLEAIGLRHVKDVRLLGLDANYYATTREEFSAEEDEVGPG